MEYTPIFWIIVGILLLEFCIDKYLDAKNRQCYALPLPEEVKDIYDADAYAKQQRYAAANDKLGSFSDAAALILSLLMLFLFGFKWIDEFVRSLELGEISTSVCFMVIVTVLSDIVSIPFEAYKTFVIEEKFGFNKMTIGTFVGDTIKNMFLTAVMMGVVMALLCYIYQWLGANYWVIGWIVMSAIMIFFMMFYSTLIVPLFNKQTPLPDGELRAAIENFCSKVDFRLDNLYIIDGSKRTSKANAYFSGIGSRKRICLYDTLVDTMTTEEIVAVLSHEIGHYKHGHTKKLMAFSIVNIGLMLFLSSIALGDPEIGNVALAEALGSQIPSFHLSMLVFVMLFSPVSSLVGVLLNAVSRKYEYQADNYAKKQGQAELLISALKKLTAKALSNLTPHPLYVAYHYNHPTLVQRIKALADRKE